MSGFQQESQVTVNYQIIENNCNRKLRSILAEQLIGKKCLAIQRDLIGIYDRLSAGLTKNAREQLELFEITSIVFFGNNSPDYKADQSYLVYFVSPLSVNLQILESHWKKLAISANAHKPKMVVIFYPQKLTICDHFLERKGLCDDILSFDLGSSFVPVDKDLWTFDAPFIFENLFLENDTSWIGVLAKSLVTLQNQDMFGNISRICGIGKYSSMINECLKNMQEARKSYKVNGGVSDIHTVILIDRDVDYITPLVTPLTYEAALDDEYGWHCGKIKFPQPENNSDRQIMFNSVTPFVDEIRNLHILATLKRLVAIGERLHKGEQEVAELGSVTKLKSFVDKLPEHLQEKTFIATHFDLISRIIEKKGTRQLAEQLHIEHSLLKMINTNDCLAAIEDIMSNAVYGDLADMNLCLRLACLAAVTNDGLSPNDFAKFNAALFCTFGPDVLVKIKKLEEAGLFYESYSAMAPSAVRQLVSSASKTSWSFKNACKRLPLAPPVNSGVPNESNPTEPSYIFNGAYIPLSVRLVESFMSHSPGQKPPDDYANFLKYKPFMDDLSSSLKGTGGLPSSSWPKSALVCYVGGVTFAEIAALRLLGKQRGCQMIIASTALLNGKTFIHQFR